MQVDIIDTYEDFKKLKNYWDAVYESDPEAQFFLSWTWFSQVFSVHKTDWFIFAVRAGADNSDYVAFFPLRMKTRMSNTLQELYNEISVAGRYFWADYSGFICIPDYEEAVIPRLALQLKEMHWRDIYLKNLSVSDKRLNLFLNQFDKNSISLKYLERTSKSDNINRLICPYVDLPNDFETYLKDKLSANTRQKIRRFLRKVENSDELNITQAEPETYERDVNILVNYWMDKWRDRKGNNVVNLADKYREILLHGLKNETIFMPVLWRGEKPLGALGSYIDGQKKTLLYFVAGRDESCNSPPPGLVLHAYSIRWAIENGLKSYDYLRGNEQFKYSYGATDRKIRYLLLSTKSGANHNRTLDPRCIHKARKLASRYKKYGRYREAEICYQQILEIKPDDLTVLQSYGQLLLKTDDYTEARKVYLKLLEYDPDNKQGWYGLGKSLLALNKYKSAEFAIRKTIELSTTGKISARYYLGRALHGRNMKAEAANEYSAILKLEPLDKWEMKKQQKAEKYLKYYRRT